MKDMNNRARSVAAGVVSGAGWCQPVLETPHFDESAPSRTRPSLDPMVFGAKRRRLWVSLQQGSWRDGCALRVVPGARAHTKGVTGWTGPKWRGGQVAWRPPARCF